MEPSPSNTGASSDLAYHHLDTISPTIASPTCDRWNSDEEAASTVNSVDVHDFTANLPDELLASVLRFLRSGYRKTCSTVCRCWLRVDADTVTGFCSTLIPILSPFLRRFSRALDAVARLVLRCDYESASMSDEALVLISMKCRRFTDLSIRSCRDGIAAFAANCKTLRKYSCGFCTFGTEGIKAVINHCVNLVEIYIEALKGINNSVDQVRPGAAASYWRSICLKDLINGQCFTPLLIGAKNLKSLKLVRCSGNWDDVLHGLGRHNNSGLVEVYLERIIVSDVGISDIAQCKGVEFLSLIKNLQWSNFGLKALAGNCKLLRTLHIDGDGRRRTGDDGLIAIAKRCVNLQLPVVIGIDATHSSLALIASNCKRLEALAFYFS